MDRAHSTERPGKSPQSQQNRRQLSAAASKDRLIEATILCMANYGPAGVSIERITDAAGVSRGLVRHHFGSKRQLLLEAFQRLADGERRAFSAGPAEDDDPVATLRAIVATEFREELAAPERAHAWFGFWQAALGDPDLKEINELVYAEERERYSELFREAARRQGLDIDPRRAGIGLVALADGAWIELLMAATDFSVDEALAVCDEYIDMILERGRSGRGRAAGD
ncbi:MAG TPA: TetR family transcriptional regulator C-terminal domain-containing protein [Thermoleophilia bacterium]|nr:TetR family transcriptional regulator C-terminal domain-containing protein [Thermoleophilia bacterium]